MSETPERESSPLDEEEEDDAHDVESAEAELEEFQRTVGPALVMRANRSLVTWVIRTLIGVGLLWWISTRLAWVKWLFIPHALLAVASLVITLRFRRKGLEMMADADRGFDNVDHD